MSSLLPPVSPPRLLGSRQRKQTEFLGTRATEAQLQNMDPDIDSEANKVNEDASDDFDWLPPDSTRPSPEPGTWNQTYQGKTLASSASNKEVKWQILCQEECKQLSPLILMNGLHQELNASSTPHGKLRKPPVCHDIPWAHLKAVLGEMEQQERYALGSLKRAMAPDFKRYVCWGNTKNLRAGHNGCNASGAKDTLLTFSGSSKQKAQNFVEGCVNNYGAKNIWV
jgi:hypothetical protein